jgi:hypothetical protein
MVVNGIISSGISVIPQFPKSAWDPEWTTLMKVHSKKVTTILSEYILWGELDCRRLIKGTKMQHAEEMASTPTRDDEAVG